MSSIWSSMRVNAVVWRPAREGLTGASQGKNGRADVPLLRIRPLEYTSPGDWSRARARARGTSDGPAVGETGSRLARCNSVGGSGGGHRSGGGAAKGAAFVARGRPVLVRVDRQKSRPGGRQRLRARAVSRLALLCG